MQVYGSENYRKYRGCVGGLNSLSFVGRGWNS